MHIISGETYHIYNQGKNKEAIFLTEEKTKVCYNSSVILLLI